MIYNIYTNRDTTLYEKYPTQNTGIDPILTLAKVASGSLISGFYQSNTYNTRILLDFSSNLAEISGSIVSGEIPIPGTHADSSSFFLILNANDASSLPISYSLVAYPISASWDNGTGYFDDIPITKNGASWRYRDAADNVEWIPAGTVPTSGGGGGTSETGGGTWYTSSVATASFNYSSPDIRMNITSIVQQWLSHEIPNNGLILKRPTIDETNGTVQGNLHFFGRDTHTIYMPKIEIAWNDSVINTTGLTELIDDNITLYFKNLKPTYKENTRTKLRLVGRKTYPTKTYSTASFYSTVQHLPTSSYYSIKDAYTEETIVPFSDAYTKISCDSMGNYFNVRLNGLLPERTYRFCIKTINDGGDNTRYHDNGYYFKVVR
jgi:hypothetical protein